MSSTIMVFYFFPALLQPGSAATTTFLPVTQRTSPNSNGATAVASSIKNKEFSCNGQDGLFPDPDDCSAFYECYGGEGQNNVRKTCGLGTIFNPKCDCCDWPANYKCTVPNSNLKSTTEKTAFTAITTSKKHPTKTNVVAVNNGEKFSCNGQDGLFADPLDCSAFYECYGGAGQNNVRKTCGIGTIFNPKCDCCDWPANYECTGSNPDPTATEKTTLKAPDTKRNLETTPTSSTKKTLPSQTTTVTYHDHSDPKETTPTTPNTTRKATASQISTEQPVSSTTRNANSNRGTTTSVPISSGNTTSKASKTGTTITRTIRTTENENLKTITTENRITSIATTLSEVTTTRKPTSSQISTEQPVSSTTSNTNRGTTASATSAPVSSGKPTLRASTAGKMTITQTIRTTGNPTIERTTKSVATTPNTAAKTVASGGNNEEFSCNGQDGTFADPDDCSAFYECADSGQTKVRKICGIGTIFNPSCVCCDWPYNYKCTVTNTDPKPTTEKNAFTVITTTKKQPTTVVGHGGNNEEFSCNGQDGTFADPDDCSAFYECADSGQTKVRKICGTGTIFNPSCVCCDWPANYDCTVPNTDPKPTTETGGNNEGFSCNGQDGTFADPDDCSAFYECADSGQTKVRKICGTGTIFNPSCVCCDWPANYDCTVPNTDPKPTTETSSNNEGFSCNGQDGTFADPDDCSAFYECADSGQTKVRKICGPGTIFNPNCVCCDWPYNYVCPE